MRSKDVGIARGRPLATLDPKPREYNKLKEGEKNRSDIGGPADAEQMIQGLCIRVLYEAMARLTAIHSGLLPGGGP